MNAIDHHNAICLNILILFFFTSAALAEGHWTAYGDNIYSTNSGNVGIGTTNPGVKLDIVDGRLRVKIRNSEQIRLWDPVTSWAGSLGLQGNDSAGNPTTYALVQGGVVNSTDGAESGKLDFHIIDNGSSGTKMTILNNGNVGIGKTNPGAKLDVNGNAIIGAAANTDTTIPLRLGGLAVSAGAMRYGNYGGILFDVNSAYTASARRFLITNALAINKFGIIRSVDAHKDPTMGKAGAITSGTADFVIDNTGNVGIGTSSPGAKLDVYGSNGAGNKVDGLVEIRNTGDGGGLIVKSTGTYPHTDRGPFQVYYDNGNIPIINTQNNGDVGIGTKNPGAKLDVNGNAIIGAAANTDTTIPLRLGGLAVSAGAMRYGNYGGILFDVNSAYTASARRYLITNALAINKFGIIRSVDAHKDPTIGKAGAITSGAADFVIDNNGNVGIGTTSPQSKLAVKGTITAEEIKVESGWSDFVFDEDYDLASLGEIESYIRKNKHLPNIPAAKEVEQQGVAVSEMLAKQMQKIEEMTLYLIQLKKENDQLKERGIALRRNPVRQGQNNRMQSFTS